MSIPFRFQPDPFIVPSCSGPIEWLYEDSHCVIVHKPAGLLTVPGRLPENSDSLISRVQEKFPEARVVHRLDLETSGLVVLALGKEATSAFGKLFEQRQIEKRYCAVVSGLVEAEHGFVEAPLITDWPNRPLQKVCAIDGKPSRTEYSVLSRDTENQQTRLSLVPHTGRSHQLRIHMRELGHPILGCPMYAPDDVCGAADRLLLHAEFLRFLSPFSGEVVEVFRGAGF